MPGSTPKGVPYILGTDAAADIDTQMQALAEWLDARPGIEAMTTATRDALAPAQKWVGRIIWNTTEARLQQWTGADWTTPNLPKFQPADGATLVSEYPLGQSGWLIPSGTTGMPSTEWGFLQTIRHGNDAWQWWYGITGGARGQRWYRTALADAWSAWVQDDGPKTVRIPHTWHVPGEVKVAAGDTDRILPMWTNASALQTVTAFRLRHRINSGTSVTVEIRNEATGAVLLGPVSVTTTGAGTLFAANTVLADATRLVPVVTAVSGTPKNMMLTAELDYTF